MAKPIVDRDPSAEQARGWVQRVLPAATHVLGVELHYVESRFWGWCGEHAHIVTLKSMREAMGVLADDYGQFLRYRPAVGAQSQLRDEAVTAAGPAALALHNALLASPEFGAAVADADARARALGWSGPTPDEHDRLMLRKIAQCVINNLHEVGNAYPWAPMWNLDRERFHAVLRQGQVAECSAALVVRGDRLAAATRQVHRAIDDERMALADEHNLPLTPQL